MWVVGLHIDPLNLNLFFRFSLPSYSFFFSICQQNYSDPIRQLYQRQNATQRYRDKGNVFTLLLCLWLLIARPSQGVCLLGYHSEACGQYSASEITPRLFSLGFGYSGIYFISLQKEKDKIAMMHLQVQKYAYSTLIFLLVLSGDIHLNPGQQSLGNPNILPIDFCVTAQIQHKFAKGEQPAMFC